MKTESNSNSILIVEDDEIVLKNIKQFLLMEGYKVETASNGREALNILSNFYPSLIISDVLMPEMDGFKFIKEVQNNPATSNIPFVFLTARMGSDDVRNGMNLGADDYITKPFKLKDLLQAVQTRLNKHKKNVKELEETKTHISLSLPHELRTPLVSIMGYTDLILDDLDSLSKTEIRDMLEDVKKSNKRLHKLVEKFILYTHLNLETKTDQLNEELLYEKFQSITELTLKVIEELDKSYNRKKDIQLSLTAEAPNLQVNHMQFILFELLENAMKFSDKKSYIIVKSSLEKEKFILKVRDHGRGMTLEEIKKVSLFKQFNRNEYQQSGIGLGLIIINKLLKHYEGEIKLRSKKNEFTEVEVILPININILKGNSDVKESNKQITC